MAQKAQTQKAQTPRKTATQTATRNGTPAEARKPSGQALQVVDVAVGAVPTAADAVKQTVEKVRDTEARNQELETLQHQVQNLLDSNTRPAQVETLKRRFSDQVEKAETRGGDVRRQVTDQVVAEARKARQRVEPVYRERVEPVYKQRVEPVYKQRIEPTVKKVRERV
ncbi:MAG TPA: hypothetical protein VFN15_06190 [Solirubrobacterales bacterium]|nr:hypothetical protein [Solirubrobacterales bacterium]